jgi:hypothetical protein
MRKHRIQPERFGIAPSFTYSRDCVAQRPFLKKTRSSIFYSQWGLMHGQWQRLYRMVVNPARTKNFLWNKDTLSPLAAGVPSLIAPEKQIEFL